jgi:hypothetical protein
MGIAARQVRLVSGPAPDAAPESPAAHLTAEGLYQLELIVVNEAGNVATSALCQATIIQGAKPFLRFNGSSAYVDMGAGKLDNQTDFTLAAWVRIKDAPGSGGYYTLRDPITGNTLFTDATTVTTEMPTIPGDYSHFQITAQGDSDVLNGAGWQEVADFPVELTFARPTADTNLAWFVWFTNLNESVTLRRSIADIIYIEVLPSPSASNSYSRLAIPGGGKVGAGSNNNFSGGGAGHGGQGGRYQQRGAGGSAYDELKTPTLPGSGGGGRQGLTIAGTTGGGVVRIEAGNTLQIDGKITANSIKSSNNYVGAGSGGAVWLTTRRLGGSGSITANGGNGGTYSGAGSGGRIAIWRASDAPGLALTVTANAGSSGGINEIEPGTIHWKKSKVLS